MSLYMTKSLYKDSQNIALKRASNLTLILNFQHNFRRDLRFVQNNNKIVQGEKPEDTGICFRNAISLPLLRTTNELHIMVIRLYCNVDNAVQQFEYRGVLVNRLDIKSDMIKGSDSFV